MANGYQLWAPWSPLDESLQWLRGAVPRPSSTKHPFRGGPSPATTTDLEEQLCFQGLNLVLEPSAKSGGRTLPALGVAAETKGCSAALHKPQAVRLTGLDSVFGHLVTAQPPQWTGSLRVSERSAFCQVISPQQRRPHGLREPQVRMAMAMCRQMLRAILLLYAAYKKCAFALQHSR
ncbi:FANCD2 opposite strand protein [Anolis carolinensis]|uniref:FANCD2 opposite strand n=1 Tax=Anolis carolinensis TaxID=28377 RepID=G1KIJ1_ANOCA|nr:PREDICTED: FANCD2 opposite strand protein [Anolis carolinensis]|eukprot:XP_003222331.1 PREDICTED: FANCD2 opposite strand protein [Anolis carolinensis]